MINFVKYDTRVTFQSFTWTGGLFFYINRLIININVDLMGVEFYFYPIIDQETANQEIQ
jgi:hypothetical protein